MGDGFEYRLTSTNVLPFNAPTGADLPWGVRLSPSGRLNIGPFFTELRLEGGAARAATTPSGDNYFEATPSSTLSDKAFGCWVYQPSDSKDTQRANFCIRSLNLGFRIGDDFQIRFGRHRYEVTEYEQMFMANAFTHTPHWANLYIPYGWLGGEVRYNREREDETVRRLMLSAAMMDGADGGYLGLLQAHIGFGESHNASRLTFTGYAALRSNPNNPDSTVIDKGMAHGEGVGVQFDHGIFGMGAGYSHQVSSWKVQSGLQPFQGRDEITGFLDFHPGSFRFRGSLSNLFRSDYKGPYIFDPAVPTNEFKTELTAGYHLTNGVLLSLGYVGAFGNHLSENILFIGFNTSYRGLIPFGG